MKTLLVVLAVGMLVLASCSKPEEPTEPIPIEQSLSVNLSEYLPKSLDGIEMLEFSKDNNYICVYDTSYPFSRMFVFGINGNFVPEAVDAKGKMQEKFLELFPQNPMKNYHADFVLNSCYHDCGVSPDYKMGFRIANPRKYDAGYMKVIYQGELWQLKPERKLLWSVDLPPFYEASELLVADYFQKDNKKYIVISVGLDKGYILSQDDGSLVHEFTFTFNAFDFCVHPARRIIACGASEGKRVQVVSLDPPFPTLFEANAEYPPYEHGRVWHVQDIDFAGDKYLIVKYWAAGRYTSGYKQPSDIFEIDTWKRIWHENSTDIDNVCISADGAKIALYHRETHTLEMGKFVPQNMPPK